MSGAVGLPREWLAQRRAAAGYTSQEALARAMGLTGPKLSNMVSGKRRLQATEIGALASALKVSQQELLAALTGSAAQPSVAETIAQFIERFPKPEWDRLVSRADVAAAIRKEFSA